MAHYDLGNDFYALWLDPGDAIFLGDLTTGDDGPVWRRRRRQSSTASSTLLDCAAANACWRSVAAGAAWPSAWRHAGAHVTALTLSPAQLRPRHAPGWREPGWTGASNSGCGTTAKSTAASTAIVSVEMIEAVGEAHWPTLFPRACARAWRPAARVVLQAITIDDDRFETYRRSPDFIQHAIFPGGMLPSPGRSPALSGTPRAGGRGASESFGDIYARTLAEWRTRFHAPGRRSRRWASPPRFRRLWDYYLAYCEAGFRTGRVDVGLWRLEPL